ncbi:hypothetical protein BKA70DRAFT_1435170 [Coprinopsis sp. MPI-PUGE-AT-0042]|nr:hypothetical protein BKA70DRAFT_1435170 [Coprinopsis sp. MPI-PUGE-AT-0042]
MANANLPGDSASVGALLPIPDMDNDYTDAEFEKYGAQYPEAWTDFYGTPSRAACLYKTGPTWSPRVEDIWSCPIHREMRPGYDDHPIAPVWDELLGFGHIDVAIREWRTVPLCRGGRLDFLSIHDDIREYRHPFSSTPSLSIAPLAAADAGGSASLFFRVNSDSDEVFVLAAVHVACPIPESSSTEDDNRSQEIILLGSNAYDNATEKISGAIRVFETSVRVREKRIQALRDDLEHGVPPERYKRAIRNLASEIDLFREKVNTLLALNSRLATEDWSNVEQRVIGKTLHVDPIARGPMGCMFDWAAVKLDKRQVQLVYLSGQPDLPRLRISDFARLMFPNPLDREISHALPFGFLQVTGIAPEDELRNPKTLSADNDRGMPVIKNGMGTRSTVGWVNGLKTFTRSYTATATTFDSRQLTIIPYSEERGPFSARGDSGLAVLDRQGRVARELASDSKLKAIPTPSPPAFKAHLQHIRSQLLIPARLYENMSQENASIGPAASSNTKDDRTAEPPVQQGEYTDAEAKQLENDYPEAWADFFGLPSRAPCLYKTGPVWSPPVVDI